MDSLPKWARDEIGRLDREVAHLRETLATGPEDSDTFADPYSDSPRPLGRGTAVEFQLTGDRPGQKALAKMGADNSGRRFLEVHGGDSMIVRPVASNVVRLYLERFR
jgi:hypothetical protein